MLLVIKCSGFPKIRASLFSLMTYTMLGGSVSSDNSVWINSTFPRGIVLSFPKEHRLSFLKSVILIYFHSQAKVRASVIEGESVKSDTGKSELKLSLLSLTSCMKLTICFLPHPEHSFALLISKNLMSSDIKQLLISTQPTSILLLLYIEVVFQL